jgi:hypothetical protein
MADRESPMGCLDIMTNINSGQTATVSDELSALVLIGAVVYGATGVTATIRKNGATAAVATYTTTEGNACTLDDANTDFSTTDALTIVISGANATRVVLHTRYPDSVAYPIKVTVV